MPDTPKPHTTIAAQAALGAAAQAAAAAHDCHLLLTDELAGTATDPTTVPDHHRTTPEVNAALLHSAAATTTHLLRAVTAVATLTTIGPPGDTPLRHRDGADPTTATQLTRHNIHLAKAALYEAAAALDTAHTHAEALTTNPPAPVQGSDVPA